MTYIIAALSEVRYNKYGQPAGRESIASKRALKQRPKPEK